ncbi:TonB-dependent receptor [Budvicia aquatica]|nr:TonB-dependent receptor [Budvicia aquatica]VFS49058.1 ferrichrome receptor precursor protein [Budvicia aquatica]
MIRYDINKEWQVQVNANNLANKKYVSACDYWCYYGDGRTVTAKLSYHW